MKCYVMLCEMLYVKIEIISIFHEIKNITTLLYPDLFAPNLDKVEGGCMTLYNPCYHMEYHKLQNSYYDTHIVIEWFDASEIIFCGRL